MSLLDHLRSLNSIAYVLKETGGTGTSNNRMPDSDKRTQSTRRAASHTLPVMGSHPLTDIPARFFE